MNARLLSVILGGCLLLSAIGISAEEVKSLPQIGVVKTWGELLAQKPVTLQNVKKNAANQDLSAKTDNSLTFRLGIDRTASKKYGGVLLYCFAQGDVAQIDQQTDLSDPSIGPFLIDVRGSNEGELQQIKAMVTDRFMISHPNALFMKPLPLNDAGPYVITLRQALGCEKFRDVASVKVLVAQNLEVSWSPWLEPKDARQAVEMTDYAQIDVANPSSGIALPKWDGSEPIFCDELPKVNRLLPEWIAAQPDPGIQLKLKDNNLVVKLDEDISSNNTDELFLTRWWVNDKPFTPKTERAEPLMLRSQGARVIPVKEVCFRMEFHPEYLNLKQGDTVGVQLLYCPRGWDWTGPVQVIQAQVTMASELAKIDEDSASKPIARMSNRIHFVYSGNPQSPAKTDKP